MKLGIVIILIGLAWCARCYMLRPQPVEIATAEEAAKPVSTGSFPRGLLRLVPLPEPAEEGSVVSYTYWSAPTFSGPGVTRSGIAARDYVFKGGEWVDSGDPWAWPHGLKWGDKP